MPSFPARTTRTALGPSRRNLGNVAGPPETSWNAGDINTLRWMYGAAGLLLPLARASFVTAATTGALTLPARKEAWDPDDLGDQGPTIARSSEGVFTLTYPTHALDVDGTSVGLTLSDAIAQAQDSGTVEAKARVTAANVITISVRATPGGSPADSVGTRIVVVIW
jgi:hypothetical protein